MKIREVRIAKGMTTTELVAKSDVARSKLSLYENDKGNPTIKTLQKIAKALECDVKELL